MASAVEGRDYLVDHYAVLGVERNASAEEIDAAYTRGIVGFHPDKVSHLDQRLQRTAEQLTQASTRAHAVLSDSQKRQEYDAELEAWGNRPLSTTGNPVLVVGIGTVSWTGSAGPEAVRQSVEELVAAGRRMLGVRPGALERAKRRFKADADDADARQDYLDALEAQHNALELEEYTRAEALGVQVDELPVGSSHLLELQAGLEEARAKLEHVIGAMEIDAVRRLALESGASADAGQPALLPQGVPDPSPILAAFAEQQERVLQLAEQRAVVAETRLEVTRLVYDFPDAPRTDRVAVRIHSDDQEMWLCLRLTLDPATESVQADADEALTHDLMTRPADPQFSQELRDAGVDVATLTLVDGLDRSELLQAALGHHAAECFRPPTSEQPATTTQKADASKARPAPRPAQGMLTPVNAPAAARPDASARGRRPG